MREESSGSGDGESLDGQKNQHADGLDMGYEGKRNLEWCLEYWPEQTVWQLYYSLRKSSFLNGYFKNSKYIFPLKNYLK